MLRGMILVGLVVIASVLVRVDGDPARPASAALIQAGDCLDQRVTQTPAIQSPGSGSGLSVRGLAAMLGIGVLTIMFFLPAALLSELLMRRGKNPEHSEVTWEGR
ncbi:hypothetical protein E2F43_01205 [Seongchinamella unica]|uniref:Uncharacterized protein n=1 Tax=Seongchinamella unica TaxID=2547392 RepID=A0A4R5LU56_9GAMM|nr:hypothetical protein [Seongchinamella unica]TDG14890.1 hypothetical protein E2F43_01205 [Seongchinamella unica]